MGNLQVYKRNFTPSKNDFYNLKSDVLTFF